MYFVIVLLTTVVLPLGSIAIEKAVSELGYANIAKGLAGVLSLLWPVWTGPAAFAGGPFLGFAGVKHLRNKERNAKENLAG